MMFLSGKDLENLVALLHGKQEEWNRTLAAQLKALAEGQNATNLGYLQNLEQIQRIEKGMDALLQSHAALKADLDGLNGLFLDRYKFVESNLQDLQGQLAEWGKVFAVQVATLGERLGAIEAEMVGLRKQGHFEIMGEMVPIKNSLSEIQRRLTMQVDLVGAALKAPRSSGKNGKRKP